MSFVSKVDILSSFLRSVIFYIVRVFLPLLIIKVFIVSYIVTLYVEAIRSPYSI